MGSLNLAQTFVGTFKAEADVDLQATLTVPAITIDDFVFDFPSVSAIFHYDQVFANASTTGAGNSFGGVPVISFEDVEIDLGGFITGFVGPIVGQIGDVIDPLLPLVHVLTDEIPLLKELGASQTSLIDIAGTLLGQTKYAGVVKAVDAILDFVLLVEKVDDFIDASGGGPLVISYGSFTVGGDARSGGQGSLNVAPPAPGTTHDPSGQLDSGPSSTKKDKAKSVVSSFGTTKGSLQFPMLSDPLSAFGLLLGKSVDLFIYDLPVLSLDFQYVKSFPIFPGLNARLGGGVSASTNFSFGFDTSGFNEWKAGWSGPGGSFQASDLGQLGTVFNGFFLDDHGIENTSGDQPEATITASIVAGASVGIGGLIEAGVEGTIKATIDFDLNDVKNPNAFPGSGIPEFDGKIRAEELIARANQGIECIFDTHGALTFALDAFFWVGADLGFLGKITIFEARKNFFSATLAEFDHACPDLDIPKLAHMNGSDLVLDMDGVVGQSGFSALEDDDGNRIGESYKVGVLQLPTDVVVDADGQITDGGTLDGPMEDFVTVGARGFLNFFRASGVDSVSTTATAYADEIQVASNVQANLNLHGGSGDDHIMIDSDGTHSVAIFGDDDDDILIGGAFADTIEGGAGKDKIYGLGGNDILRGDAGLDIIVGGQGNDELHGGSGDDRLAGEEGADKLFGDAGADTLTGGKGVDEGRGGTGGDTFVWTFGDGADSVWIGGNSTATNPDDQIESQEPDTARLIGIVLDENMQTVPVDDTVGLSANSVDVDVSWGRPGTSTNVYTLQGFERVTLDLADGADAVTIGNLDGTTVGNVDVDFGETQREETAVVDMVIRDASGNFVDFIYDPRDLDANGDPKTVHEVLDANGDPVLDVNGDPTFETRAARILTEVIKTTLKGTDGQADTLLLLGSSGVDTFELTAADANALGIDQFVDRPGGATGDRVLSIQLENSESGFDRLDIQTLGDGDRVDASDVVVRHLIVLGIDTGAGNDTVIGSSFVDHINTGADDDTVTGGPGVDQFADSGGDDTLVESRDVHFDLSDIELSIHTKADSYGINNTQVTSGTPITEKENIAGPGLNGAGGGIFETIRLTGYDDTRGLEGALSENTFTVDDFTMTAFLNGGPADDFYDIILSGGAAAQFSSVVYISDDGGKGLAHLPQGAGLDTLNVEGTAVDDTFAFAPQLVERLTTADVSPGDAGFTPITDFGNISTDPVVRSFAAGPDVSRQTVIYGEGIVEAFEVHGGFGDDIFIVDDSSTELFVFGDSGDDAFFIGSVTATTTITNPEDPLGPGILVVDRTSGGRRYHQRRIVPCGVPRRQGQRLFRGEPQHRRDFLVRRGRRRRLLPEGASHDRAGR